MRYLKAEHLKFKRTITNKLLWVAPFTTALLAWIISGFYGFQYMTFYWWYSFLLPGTIAILCVLSHQKEERAGNYYSILALPVDFKKVEMAKSLIIVGKLFVATLILSFMVSISNVISPALAVYSPKLNIFGSIVIIIASIWQVPLCLYLGRRNIILPIIFNTVCGIFMPIILGKSFLTWWCPYCWVGKIVEQFMGIGINGTYMGNVNTNWSVLLALILPALLFSLFVVLDARDFEQREVR